MSPLSGISTAAASIRIPCSCFRLSSKTPFSSSSSSSYRTVIKMPHSTSTSTATAASISTTAASTSSNSQEAVEEVKKPKHPWLIVGLGNPGKMFSGTRHNVGFDLVDALAQAEGISMGSVQSKALFGKGFIGNVPVMLAKPQTFMNLSGQSVKALVSYYKIPLKQVLVVYDDMDLPFAKLRLLPKGGHGGHNGMRSIIEHVKEKDFPRLKIGIGRPPGKMDGAAYVLRPFSKQERAELDFTLQTGLEAIRILLLESFDKGASYANSPRALEQLG